MLSENHYPQGFHDRFIKFETIINHCRHWLAGPIYQNIAVVGEHGFGKTTMLRYLEKVAEKEGWGTSDTQLLFIYVDCSPIQPFTPTKFWYYVLQGLLEKSQRIPHLEERIKNILHKDEVNFFDLQNHVFQNLSQQVSLVLLLDEFDTIVKTNTADPLAVSSFLSGLRAISSKQTHALVTSTRESPRHLTSEALRYQEENSSGFFNPFRIESLTVKPHETKDMLKQVLDEIDLRLDQTDFEFLFNLAGCHPALLDRAVSIFRNECHQPTLTEQTKKEINKEFRAQAEHYYSQFWNKSSALEQALLVLLILSNLAQESFSELSIPMPEIHSLLEHYNTSVLQPLEERGLVYEMDGTYHLLAIPFALWIADIVAREDETQLTERYRQLSTEKLLHWVWQIFFELTRYPISIKVKQTLEGRLYSPTTPSSHSPIGTPSQTNPTLFRKPNLRTIRDLLTKAFEDSELGRLTFYQPEFRSVYEKFSDGMSKEQKIDLIVEYAERQILIDKLLVLIKENNPRQYEAFEKDLYD
jgi:hypothetical protein